MTGSSPDTVERRRIGIFANGISLIGVLLGAVFIGPRIHTGDLIGALIIGAGIGYFMAAGVNLLLFPAIRKEVNSPENKKRVDNFEKQLNKKYTHPTNIPMYLGMLWFLLVCLGIWVVSYFLGYFEDKRLLPLFLPTFFGFGLSGFRKIRRGESIDKFGYLVSGFGTYFEGIALILVGWGGILVTIYLQLIGR